MPTKDERISELRKALTVSGTGQYLVPEDLEPLIRENLLELSPLTAMIPNVVADGHIHEVVRRTATGGTARFEGELTAASYGQSTYGRRTTTVKRVRAHGQVSDFNVSAAKSFTDVLADEIDAATEDVADLFEFAGIWAHSDELTMAGDAYQCSGVYAYILYDAASTCVIDCGADAITLTDLDEALNITKNKYRNLRTAKWVWLMSPAIISKISGLESRISRDVPTIDYEGKFTMKTYDGVPMLPSGFVTPSTTSPTGLAAATGTASGGSLADGTYYYGVAAITIYGEQKATTGVSAAVSGGGGAGSVTLTWTADGDAQLYAIYRTGAGEADAAANYDLIDITAGASYSSDGTPTFDIATYTELGTLSANTTVHPLASTDEIIFLIALDTNQGLSRPVLSPTLGDPISDLIHYVPLTETTDSYQFRLKSYHCYQVPWGAVHACLRRCRKA